MTLTGTLMPYIPGLMIQTSTVGYTRLGLTLTHFASSYYFLFDFSILHYS